MFKQIFSIIGGAIGHSFGGGILSTIGRFTGRMLGDYLDHINYEPSEYHTFRNIKDSFYLSTASYGKPIALIFGTVKTEGFVIWSTQIYEDMSTVTSNKYFSHSNQVRAIHHTTECEYYISCAVAICEGQLAEVSRIWANGVIVDLNNYKHKLYFGGEIQTQDPLIASYYPEAAIPAFRDLAYIVFENLPLADFGNIVPRFEFEVTRRPNVDTQTSVEDLVTSMVVIPGSGEFVYDTSIQYKTIVNNEGVKVAQEKINSHNELGRANSIRSLDQMQLVCPNIQWVAPVVCWFGNDINIENCNIQPAIEFNDLGTVYSEQWSVAEYDRYSARVISRDALGNPQYGGSISDAGILRYLQELKRRNLKIMFYPMILIDVNGKPWRGHLTGAPEAVKPFFNKTTGYNAFILHYAKLVKDYVDVFIIGSELVSLTKIRTDDNTFPAVLELCNLAESVKKIMGPNVLITYAADWSEYHHTEGGWYNLDPLWASLYIDFIGIDAYFPVTNTTSSIISMNEIMQGWQSGEGYDYYFDHNHVKQPLAAPYAWKNIKFWWENYHTNPNNKITEWKPCLKAIWFTEFGFPSVDKSTNQPNVFYDPNCADGGLPKHSLGNIDFSIQRLAIKAFIKYWQSQKYVSNMFLWTWDARPYPAWPHMDIWRDSNLWERGHWVNNKFGTASVAAIILELSQRCSIALNKIDVSLLDESIAGVIFNKAITGMDAINILRTSYFFDVVACTQDIVCFTKRAQMIPHHVSGSTLLKLSDNRYVRKQHIAKTNVVSKLDLYFMDRSQQYAVTHYKGDNEHLSNKRNVVLKLPFVLSLSEVEGIGQMILDNAWRESAIIEFVLPLSYFNIKPADFIILQHNISVSSAYSDYCFTGAQADDNWYNRRSIKLSFTCEHR